jgi:hypothetical protein
MTVGLEKYGRERPFRDAYVAYHIEECFPFGIFSLFPYRPQLADLTTKLESVISTIQDQPGVKK